jgi:hypothetical protein
MENTVAANLFLSSVALLGLAWLAFWLFKKLRIDEFRQEVFYVRDELFDFAADGNIDFNHPAYVTLRSMMNGYIRFSHRLSIFHLLAMVCTTVATNREYLPTLFNDKWEHVIADLDDDKKARMTEFRDRATNKLFTYLVLSSYSKRAFVFLTGIGAWVFLQFLKRKKASEDFGEFVFEYSTHHSAALRDSLDSLNADAYDYGRPHAFA